MNMDIIIGNIERVIMSNRSIPEMIAEGRKASAALRRLERNGGGTRATLRAQDRHVRILNAAHAALLAAGRGDLSAALTEEDEAAWRISEAKARGSAADAELTSRLAAARRALRATA